MPGPAVYIAVAVVGVFAVGLALHEFVYEPHIAPKVETWAESFLENRRQRRRRRQGHVLVDPHPFEQGDENGTRRSTDGSNDKKYDDEDDANGMSIELEQLAAKERDAWRHNAGPSSGLRQRKAAGAMDESNVSIPYPPLSPTHVIFDHSEPTSPDALSSLSSSPRSSPAHSPARSTVVLSEPQPRVAKPPSPPVCSISPRLPTPMSSYSPVSSRAMSPAAMSERSSLSSRGIALHLAASQALSSASAYDTPLGGSAFSERSRTPTEVQSIAVSRMQSPFSDIHSVDARGSPEHVTFAPSPVVTTRVRSLSVSSGVTMHSDDDFDILSPRSGMFSPPSRVDDFFYDGASQHGSEGSWASVGRRTPEF
ncbi:hypothetical protein BD413DRAFT_472337 [Trametes elegans]|nr:hypothetical protein BD413DRAFT_472337 [Trametes elegans]